MMKLLLLLGLLSFAPEAFAHRTSSHFPGYGFQWYSLVCGNACHDAIASATLSCTSMDHPGGHSGMSMTTSPDCYASDSAFLTTLALCMNTTCDSANAPTWRREKFWNTEATGDPTIPPKWDYSRAVEEIQGRPTAEFNSTSEDTLNQTMVVTKETYEVQRKFMIMFDHLEMLQAKYCIVLITIGFGTPIFFTLLARLPFMTGMLERLKPLLVYPSSVGSYNVRPIHWILGNAPTAGQVLYISMFFILNLVLSAVNYSRSQPHPWGYGPKEELLAYIGYRTGHIAYALLPLLILFSSRNNFLLWITNWSYGTYILLHRWIARIFAIQAIVHSVTLLATYKGTGSYAKESVQAYWRWGIVATVLTCAMLILSHLYFRRLAYEFFLILHIILAIFVIVGCWYHSTPRFGLTFYNNWLYAASAVWFFDRLMRVLRVAKNGMRRAIVTEIGPDHVRIDVPGIRWVSKPGHVAYAYFPSIHRLRPWENHPFSINSTSLFNSHKHALPPTSTSSSLSKSSSNDYPQDIEKSAGKIPETSVVQRKATPPSSEAVPITTTTGVTFFIKKHNGLTRLLTSHPQLLTLIDGPYPHSPSSSILKCDHLLLIGGGIGITGLVAWIHAHPNVKLAWSVKSSATALVDAMMGGVLKEVADKEVLVGERLDIGALLREEARAGYGKVGVVVCGPGGMCDDVRAGVVGMGRHSKTVFDLEVDSFSW